MTTVYQQTQRALDQSDGVLRLLPSWVPRAFMVPGRRLRLHPNDLYALGAERGGIDERWLVSCTRADNGPGTPPEEGLSRVIGADGESFLLIDAVDALGARLIGDAIWERYGRWPVLCKFFDNMGPIPHHMHQMRRHAALVGQEPKPEAYYFPAAYNQVANNFPLTYFGIEPGTTPDDVLACIRRWHEGDNGILDLSRAYRLQLNTGWMIPSGVLHAPGSLCTYEVQWGSDVYAMYQSMVDGRVIGWDNLVRNMPADRRDDPAYYIDMLDWDANTNPNFKRDHFKAPRPASGSPEEGYFDRWVVYGAVDEGDLFSARELTLEPGHSTILHEPSACGVTVLQGRGTLHRTAIEAPVLIRFGQPTRDELFISHERATGGYAVTNTGAEPLVLVRHYGPGAQGGIG